MQSTNKNDLGKKLEYLEKSVDALVRILAQPVGKERAEIDASIKRFEFAFEFTWKTLKVVLLDYYAIDAKSPKTVLQEAFQQDLIEDEIIWVEMLKDRNLTSHTYDEEMADRVYQDIKELYSSVFQKTLLMLQERFGKNA